MTRPPARSAKTPQLSLFDEPNAPVLRQAPNAEAPGDAATQTPVGFQHPRAQREVQLGEHVVAYELKRVRRRSIGFVVGPEGLSVSAPRWVSQVDIDNALQERARWICTKLHEQHERARRQLQARVEWRDGTSLPFLWETVIVALDPRVAGAVLNTDVNALPGVPRLTLHVGLPQQAAPQRAASSTF